LGGHARLILSRALMSAPVSSKSGLAGMLPVDHGAPANDNLQNVRFTHGTVK